MISLTRFSPAAASLLFASSLLAQTALPTIATAPALHGAVVVTLTDATPGAEIHYTLTAGGSPILYGGPFLLASSATLTATATANGSTSALATREFKLAIPADTLVWSDEFTLTGGGFGQPNSATWGYDHGASGYGNSELEDYCAWGSAAAPCNPATPNAFVGTDGYLHVAARQPSPGVYTSARLKSEGLFSFQYGRLEVRAKAPEAQGFWPAVWLLGSNIGKVNWPASGELDMLERVNAAETPDWNAGSIHGKGFTGSNLGTRYSFPAGHTAVEWHTYGMIWKPGSVAYYIDDASKPYATFTPSSLAALPGAVWPFDDGPEFLIVNLAVGGSWPGKPAATTPFPSELVLDYVRIYSN